MVFIITGLYRKVFILQGLRQITVLGMGLLGSSVTLAVSRALPRLRTVGFSHRASTRDKAREIGVADEICDSLEEAVAGADIVILATPIFTFKSTFEQIKPFLKKGCIVTDVGSTKVEPLKWAKEIFSKDVSYVGSHPIAGSEKRGVEYGRDDLLSGANCIITKDRSTDVASIEILKEFWSSLGAFVKIMTPAQHDRIFSRVSHLPHIAAVALTNATSNSDIEYAGKGFIDTTRVASGPSSIWSDILLANARNSSIGINMLIRELEKINAAVESGDSKRLTKLLDKACNRRKELIDLKITNGEII